MSADTERLIRDVESALIERGIAEVVNVHESHGPEVVVHDHSRSVIEAVLDVLDLERRDAENRRLGAWDALTELSDREHSLASATAGVSEVHTLVGATAEALRDELYAGKPAVAQAQENRDRRLQAATLDRLVTWLQVLAEHDPESAESAGVSVLRVQQYRDEAIRGAETHPVVASPDTLAEIDIARLSRYFDASNAHRDPEAVTAVRILKLTEEAGEAAAAYIGLIGQNPRKGVQNGLDEVLSEVLDVAVTALGIYEHLTGAKGQALTAVAEKIHAVAQRALGTGASVAAPALNPTDRERLVRATAGLSLRDRFACAIATAGVGGFSITSDPTEFVQEIERWEASADWEKDAYPDEYPGWAYEDRENFRDQADAVLALLGIPDGAFEVRP